MTAQRPNAIVFQEYATLTVTPDVPDLNVLVAGECYQILDYLDDKTDCLVASDYGTLNSNCPLSPPTAVVISSPPGILPGGELDSASAQVYFDAGRAVVYETPNPSLTSSGTYALGNNLFVGHTIASGTHFGVEEVAAGDILITECAATNDYVMTVKELCYTLNDFGGTLTFVTNGVQPGDTVILSNDAVVTPRDGTYVVKRVVSETDIEVEDADWVGHYQTGMALTVKIEINDPNGTPRITPTTLTIADYCNIRTTSDFAANSAGGYRWRVERAITDVLLDASDYVIVDNQITLNAGILTDLSSTLTGCAVSYSKIYVGYIALRTDLQQVTTLSNTSEILDILGKYDARNPLCVGAIVAKANTTTPVTIYGVTGPASIDYMDFIDRISSDQEVYAIVPLTYDTSILASLLNMATTLSDPNEALSHGFKQKFREIIAAVELQTSKYLVDATGGGTAHVKAGTIPAGNHSFQLIQTGAVSPLSLFTVGILPGDIFEVTDIAPVLTTVSYTVVQVNTTDTFEVAETAVTIDLSAGGADFFRFTRAGVLVPGATKLVGTDGVTHVGGTAAVLDALYLIFDCPKADFLTSGCLPGDYLELPTNPTVNTWTGINSTFVIDEVMSNQKVRIVNNGNNAAAVENELPHGGRRVAPGTLIVQGTLFCRVMRALSKTQQVTEMVAVAQSFGNKRIILVYPNYVDPTDLVDGSLVRTDPEVPESANPQPGYFLACAVGGQTAGNPPQQGFTNMGIAGISEIHNSSNYFTEQQLTDLSNGGVYVFIQDNVNSLPYTIHELTTDVSILEYSEYMVVKDFDFVSTTFLNVLRPFLGEWNVTLEAIEFIKQSLYTTGDVLKARYVAKIGAPLISYSLDSIAISTLSPDRIEAYMQVDLPMTLNTIGLHLVA